MGQVGVAGRQGERGDAGSPGSVGQPGNVGAVGSQGLIFTCYVMLPGIYYIGGEFGLVNVLFVRPFDDIVADKTPVTFV